MTQLFYVFVALLFAATVSAAEVSDLYQAQGAVTAQGEKERSDVTPALLREVIIKVVGDRQVVNNADLTAVLADANRFVSRYSYQRLNNDPSMTSGENLAVLIHFDALALNNALQRIGLPMWDQRRPEVLLWVATELNGQQRIVSDADEQNILALMRHHAKRRGLPVVTPLMDLQDQTQITFNDIWTNNGSAIEQASERYSTPIIVSTQLRGNSENLGIGWQLLLNHETERWQSQGSMEVAISQGIDEMADRLGRRFAQVLGDAQTVQLQFIEVNDFGDYNRLMTYLNRLQGVSDINVQNMQNQQLNVALSMQGEMNRFKQLLELGGMLQATGGDAGQGLQYRLLP